MSLFDGRSQRPMPTTAVAVNQQIPRHFVNDGCTNAPDTLFGFELGWACRIHDWRYCTRCHPAGTMTAGHRRRADAELGANVRAALPWRWRWVGWVYRTAVWRYAGISAFDSCGPSAGLKCRHHMPIPRWMRKEIS